MNKEREERERVKFLARCSVMVFAWRRRRYIYIEIVFVSVRGEGRFVGVSRRMKRGCNDASDELKLVKGGLMRVYEERKNDLSLYFNRFIV